MLVKIDVEQVSAKKTYLMALMVLFRKHRLRSSFQLWCYRYTTYGKIRQR
jgi:hypothetical protein